MNSTQKALQRSDILHEIFAHVKIPVDLSMYCNDTLPVELTDSLKTLAAAARTSKTFSRHALKLLWRDLPSFHALLYVLPSSVKVVNHQENSAPSHHVDGTPAFCYTTYWVGNIILVFPSPLWC